MNNYIVATKPLDNETVAKINPRDIAFADSRFVINYFRLSADKRLLFGGGENYSQGLSNNIIPIVTKPLEKIYPFLKGVKIDYAWGGKLAITMNRLPFYKEMNQGKVLSAQGYSGQGVALASYAGKVIAGKITGDGEIFDAMANIPMQSFPGGRFLRNPTMKVGMFYHALLDRL
jgi:gamma-glutamylputrescine oxidase